MNLVGEIYKNARTLRDREVKRSADPRCFHASESGDCRRQIALRKSGTKVEREDEPSSILRLQDGHVHHQAVRDLISQLPMVTLTNAESSEILFVELDGYPPFVITGHCDGIVNDLNGDEEAVLEVKGLNRFSFQKLKNEEIETLKAVYPKAIPQARLYMAMFEKTKAIILIKNKDTSELKQFTLEHDDAKFMKIVTRFAEIAKSVKEGDLPLCDFLKNDRRCTYCPFPSMCGR